MFCEKCGSQIKDGARFCNNCGTVVGNVGESPVYSQPVQEYAAQPPVKKKGHAWVVVLIVILVIALAGGAAGFFMWLNRPINKINKAIESDDVETVASLYGKLSNNEDKRDVRGEMLETAKELKSDYLKGNAEYEEVKDIYELLEDEILSDDEKFEEIKKAVDDVNESRTNFAEAEELFEKEEYAAAKEKYLLVIPEDSNSEDALAKVDECDQKISGMIVGTWKLDYDIWTVMKEELDSETANSIEEMKFPVNLVFSFKDNGGATLSIEITDTDVWVNSFKQYFYAVFEQEYGMDTDSLLSYIQYMGYDSLDEFVLDMMEAEMGDFSEFDELFEYQFDGSTLTFKSVEDGIEYEMEVSVTEDELTFISVDDDSWDEIGLTPPVTFKKSNDSAL